MEYKGQAAGKKPEIRGAREIHLTFDTKKYKVRRLVNVLRIKDFGEVDIGDILSRKDAQIAMDQGIKVFIDDGEQYKSRR